jgi:hypothetical protein
MYIHVVIFYFPTAIWKLPFLTYGFLHLSLCMVIRLIAGQKILLQLYSNESVVQWAIARVCPHPSSTGPSPRGPWIGPSNCRQAGGPWIGPSASQQVPGELESPYSSQLKMRALMSLLT